MHSQILELIIEKTKLAKKNKLIFQDRGDRTLVKSNEGKTICDCELRRQNSGRTIIC